jgi:hypothetical protein
MDCPFPVGSKLQVDVKGLKCRFNGLLEMLRGKTGGFLDSREVEKNDVIVLRVVDGVIAHHRVNATNIDKKRALLVALGFFEDSMLYNAGLEEMFDGLSFQSTYWSEGQAVFWHLTDKTVFYPKACICFRANFDFDVYSLPPGYLAYIDERRGVFESEAFVCRTFDCSTPVASTRDQAPMLCNGVLGPPFATRPLTDPHSFGFDTSVQGIDLMSVRVYLEKLYSTFAFVTPDSRYWEDGITGRHWDETRGKLLQKMMLLSEEDLTSHLSYHKHSGSGGACKTIDEFNMKDDIILRILQSPWILSRNVSAVLQKTANQLPLGYCWGSVMPYDTSVGNWKSRLGRRAFKGLHAPFYFAECSCEFADFVCLDEECVKKKRKRVECDKRTLEEIGKLDPKEDAKTIQRELLDLPITHCCDNRFIQISPVSKSKCISCFSDMKYSNGVFLCDACTKVGSNPLKPMAESPIMQAVCVYCKQAMVCECKQEISLINKQKKHVSCLIDEINDEVEDDLKKVSILMVIGSHTKEKRMLGMKQHIASLASHIKSGLKIVSVVDQDIKRVKRISSYSYIVVETEEVMNSVLAMQMKKEMPAVYLYSTCMKDIKQECDENEMRWHYESQANSKWRIEAMTRDKIKLSFSDRIPLRECTKCKILGEENGFCSMCEKKIVCNPHEEDDNLAFFHYPDEVSECIETKMREVLVHFF